MKPLLRLGAALLVGLTVVPARAQTAAPPPYVWATATPVLPGTHNNESGYFSLCEGHDGTLYIGTAYYGTNGYLVAFDPRTGAQRVAVDVHAACGLTARGDAAQSKIHTRNFVGPSGRLYVGSKQGEDTPGDPAVYPGGYVLVYDPATDTTENLGMPYPGQGVIDVVADESRGLLYVVTCEDQHWMRYDRRARTYRELGPRLTPYAATLVDAAGRAHALTEDFQLATYDPSADRVTTRPILLNGRPFARTNNAAIPTWILAPDARHAWLILMNDPTLIEIELAVGGKNVTAVSHGKMVEGAHPDSRCALTWAPDGRLYAVVRTDNQTGFGAGYLHHLARYDPRQRRMEDLGVLAVKNPDFFAFGPDAAGHKPPWSHGFHKLPDGTLTPLYHHMALIATADNTLYVTVLYPFTLLKIDAYRLPEPPPTPAAAYLRSLIAHTETLATRLSNFTRVAEVMAERHIAGGLIGFPWNGQTLQQELMGRSGNLVHTGFERPFKKDRTPTEQSNDVAIIGWERPPAAGEQAALEALRQRGCYIIGFGPKAMPELAPLAARCDAWFDTEQPADDRLVTLPGGGRAGHSHHVFNALHAWVLSAELVAALTRRGRMPTIWKAYAYEDGPAWGERYFGKRQFHDDYTVAPIPEGQLGAAWLQRLLYHVRRFERRELDGVRQCADQIAAERKAGRKTVVASTGHLLPFYIGRHEDAAWAQHIETHYNVPSQLDAFDQQTTNRALVLRLDYAGMHTNIVVSFRRKEARVLLVTAENPRPEFQVPADWPVRVNMGYTFGDACVALPGYPLRLFPPSGILQAIAYESIALETLAR